MFTSASCKPSLQKTLTVGYFRFFQTMQKQRPRKTCFAHSRKIMGVIESALPRRDMLDRVAVVAKVLGMGRDDVVAKQIECLVDDLYHPRLVACMKQVRGVEDDFQPG